MKDRATAAPAVRITVTRGKATATETAALVSAVLAIGGAEGEPEVRSSPAWSVAARIEATGQAPFAASSDPRLTRYSTAT